LHGALWLLPDLQFIARSFLVHVDTDFLVSWILLIEAVTRLLFFKHGQTDLWMSVELPFAAPILK
jgi:hypothetical protein